MFLVLFTVFILNVVSNTLGTLKTLFLAKKIMKPAYVVTFIDSIVFAYGFKMVATEDSLWVIVAFSLGKVVGAYLADILDNKMAFGLIEVTLYAKANRAHKLADSLRDLGYSVTTVKGYGFKGSERYEVNLTIKRKELSFIREFLGKNGILDATLVIREVSSVAGKIAVEKKNQGLEKG